MAAAEMRLRIIHLLSGDLWAGAEVATFHLIRALHERPDLNVSVVTLNEGELTPRLQELGVPFAIEPEAGRSFASLVRGVRRRVEDADLVHAHRYKENVLAACSGRPWVTTQHGLPEPFQGSAALRMRLYLGLDLLAKRFSAQRVIGVSSEVESWLATRIGRSRTVRVWNGIFDPADSVEPKPWEQRPRRVGAVARLVPVKALHLAVDAVSACPGLELEIVGDGPERDALDRRVRASGACDRIHLLGFEANPLPRMACWRVLLVPSLREGSPVSVIEALAVGTPVLAADLPGVSEILGGRGGWIERSRDPQAWADRLRAVVDDEGSGIASSEAGRGRFLADFTATKAAERTVSVYRATLAVVGRCQDEDGSS